MLEAPVPINLAMARRIEIWHTERLVPYANNARAPFRATTLRIDGGRLLVQLFNAEGDGAECTVAL